MRTHNEWFRTVSLGNRKSCPTCKAKLEPDESIWSWGEYVAGKWHTVKHFCKNCFDVEVKQPLYEHSSDCGCTIEPQRRGESFPSWLTLSEDECPTHPVAGS